MTEANREGPNFVDVGVEYGVNHLCSVELHLHNLSWEQTDLCVVLVYCELLNLECYFSTDT